MLRKALGGVVLFGLLSAALVSAVEGRSVGSAVPRGKWWKMPRLAEELNLTDEEKNQLDDLFLDYRRRLIDLKSPMERGWLELDNILEKEDLDEAAAMEEFEKVKVARSNLATERFRFLLDVRRILGSDRYQRLKALFREIRKEMKSKEYDWRSGQ